MLELLKFKKKIYKKKKKEDIFENMFFKWRISCIETIQILVMD